MNIRKGGEPWGHFELGERPAGVSNKEEEDIKVPMNVLDTSTASRRSKPRDQSTALTQENSTLNMDGTLKTQSSRKSVLLRVDSSILELAEAMREEDGDDQSEDQRESHICCLVCCDLVRACILCDVCDILLTILLIIGAYFEVEGAAFFNGTMNLNMFVKSDVDLSVIDDDELLESYENQQQGVSLVTIMVACGVVFSIIGIVGAWKLQKYMVLLSGLWYCVDVLRSAITFQYVNLLVTACFAYPHFALFHALRKNQLTKKNYENEKYCFGERCSRKSGDNC